MTVTRFSTLILVAALVLPVAPRWVAAQGQLDIAATKGAWPVLGGLLQQVEESARLLSDGQRGPAMRALNASHRLAEVGTSIAKGLSLSAAHDASETIRQARRSIQNGAPDQAVRHLGEAASRLRRLIEIGLAEADSATAVADRAHQPREDLQLLGLSGEVLGKIDRIAAAGDPPAMVIQTGPWVNVLGFLDLGAPKEKVLAEQILFGRKAAVWLDATARRRID